MEQEFLNISGYELRKWVPALMGYVVNSPESTSRFLRDWKRTTNELVVNRFYKRMAELAKEKDIYLEISARQGHCLGNGHVANVAREVGNKLLVNTDTHSPDNIITFEKSYEIALGAGLTHDEAMKAIVDNPRELLKSKGIL